MSNKFNLHKFLNENKLTEASRRLKEDGQELDKINFPNGISFEVGGEDQEGGQVIYITKHPSGHYEVAGQEYDFDNQEPGDEAYSYYYDKKGNPVDEDDVY